MGMKSDSLYVHPLSWRSRTFRAACALVLLTLAVRIAWGFYAARKLREVLDQTRSCGESVELADLQPPTIPNAENAIAEYLRASAALTTAGAPSPKSSSLQYKEYPPYPPAWYKLAEQSEISNQAAFAIARQARGLSLARTQVNISQTGWIRYVVFSPAVSRELANTLTDDAIFQHLQGHDVQALERLLDTGHVAWAVRQDGFLINSVVAKGIDALNAITCLIIAPDLNLKAGSPERATANELIKFYLDDDDCWRCWDRTIRNERVLARLNLENAGGNMWLNKPAADLEFARLSLLSDVFLSALHKPSNLESPAHLATPIWKDYSAEQDSMQSFHSIVQIVIYSRWDACMHRQCLAIGDRRAAAISLAAQMYHADTDRWPESLKALVPMYLPAVPVDPFYPSKPMAYLVARAPSLDGAERPMVAFDAYPLDEGPPPEPTYSFYSGQSGGFTHADVRQYRDLSRFSPPPSADAGDGNGDQPDAEGNHTEQKHETDEPEKQ